jgi:anti-repressor protein
MENNIQVFQNQEFGELRTVVRGGEPWFVAKDVCDALEIENSRDAVARLDTDEKNTVVLTDGTPGNPNKAIVSESGLYSLVLGSRKPQAKPFKRWVTHDVIPSIRKHGAYMTPETIEKALLNPDTIIQLATTLKSEQEKRRAAEAQIEADKPKVQFADSVGSSKQAILIREMAKLLKQNGVDMGEKRLFSWLRANGFLISCGDDYNLPTQKSMNLGLMIIRERTYTDDVHTRIMRTPMITGKGQQYFIRKFLTKKSA